MLVLPVELVHVAAATADTLASDLIIMLGPDPSLAQRVERERFVGHLAAWLSDPAMPPLAMAADVRNGLVSASLFAVGQWGDDVSAAAWQLALAAFEFSGGERADERGEGQSSTG